MVTSLTVSHGDKLTVSHGHGDKLTVSHVD